MQKGFKFKYASEISLWIDSYNDLFSDFDPRPYQEKAISDDFLEELKRAAKDKPFDKIALKLLVPKDKRSFNDEKIIKERLEEHFNHRYELIMSEKRKIVRKGVFIALLGLILLFFVLYLWESIPTHTILTDYPISVIELTMWFLFWEGMSMAIFESKNLSHNLNFYKKMSNCDIKFLPF